MKAGFMECPFCKNEIKEGAKKCQYCGEFLDETAKPKQEFYSTIELKSFQMKPKIYCPNCGYEGKAKTAAKGSTAVEILLRLFFLIPGLIYSARRGSNRYYICPKCGNDKLKKL